MRIRHALDHSDALAAGRMAGLSVNRLKGNGLDAVTRPFPRLAVLVSGISSGSVHSRRLNTWDAIACMA